MTPAPAGSIRPPSLRGRRRAGPCSTLPCLTTKKPSLPGSASPAEAIPSTPFLRPFFRPVFRTSHFGPSPAQRGNFWAPRGAPEKFRGAPKAQNGEKTVRAQLFFFFVSAGILSKSLREVPMWRIHSKYHAILKVRRAQNGPKMDPRGHPKSKK